MTHYRHIIILITLHKSVAQNDKSFNQSINQSHKLITRHKNGGACVRRVKINENVKANKLQYIKYVLRPALNDNSEPAKRTESDSLFQMCGAAHDNRRAAISILCGGTFNKSIALDRSSRAGL